jgi:hypothetical protein
MHDSNHNFQSERTQRWRESGLAPDFAHTIENVEKFGCSVMQVKSSGSHQGWSYTIGVFDTSGKPELITIGLLDETALTLLNSAADALRAGVDISVGRHREMVGEVECEFRPVAPKWVEHLMGQAVRYYEGEQFPVLQAIYPDRENRFPGEPGFEEYFTQPLMQPNLPATSVEDDFWNATDIDNKFFDWKFPDPPHRQVFLSKTVHEGTEPIVYVSHDIEDGAWQFLGDSMDAGGGPVLVCLHHPIDSDASLKELADLPLGWCAERATPNDPWVRMTHAERFGADEAIDES